MGLADERKSGGRHRCCRCRSPAAAMAGMTPIVTPLAASGFSAAGLEPAGRPAAAARHGPDGRRGRARADHPRGRGSPAGRRARRCRSRMVIGRLRPLGHRHGHPRRGQPRLRLRPPDVQPGRLRVSDDDRLHPHGLSAGQRQHEDGLAAQGRRRDRHRRQHQRRRPDRAQARHAAAERAGQDRPLCRCPHSTTSRSSASRCCCRRSDHVGAHQRHRHRGQPARGADRPAERDDPAQGPRADHAVATPSAARATPGRWGRRRLFSPLASIVNILVRNSMAPVRIESIDCDVQIEPGPQGRGDRVGPAALRHGRAGPGARRRSSR